jgi:hypothetical protein
MSADLNDEKKKRRFLSPEKKYQIFLEAQRSDVAVAGFMPPIWPVSGKR